MDCDKENKLCVAGDRQWSVTKEENSCIAVDSGVTKRRNLELLETDGRMICWVINIYSISSDASFRLNTLIRLKIPKQVIDSGYYWVTVCYLL